MKRLGNSDSVILILNLLFFLFFVFGFVLFFLIQVNLKKDTNFQQYLLYVLSEIATESISYANALYQVHNSKLCNTLPNLVGKIITSQSSLPFQSI